MYAQPHHIRARVRARTNVGVLVYASPTFAIGQLGGGLHHGLIVLEEEGLVVQVLREVRPMEPSEDRGRIVETTRGSQVERRT